MTRKSRGRSTAIQVDGIDATQVFHDACHCVEAHAACTTLVAAFANIGDNGAIGLDANCGTRVFFVPIRRRAKLTVIDQVVVSPATDGVLNFVVGVVHLYAVFGTFQLFTTFVVEERVLFVALTDNGFLLAFGVVHNGKETIRITAGMVYAFNHQSMVRGTRRSVEGRAVNCAENVPTIVGCYEVDLFFYCGHSILVFSKQFVIFLITRKNCNFAKVVVVCNTARIPNVSAGRRTVGNELAFCCAVTQVVVCLLNQFVRAPVCRVVGGRVGNGRTHKR